MSATADQIAQVRRMTREPDVSVYDDAAIGGYIEAYPLVDENGESPRVPSGSLRVEMGENPDWTPTYDLNAAASSIWMEKAANVQQDYDFEADGGKYNRSQAFRQAIVMAHYYGARRSPKTISAFPDVVNDRTYETN